MRHGRGGVRSAAADRVRGPLILRVLLIASLAGCGGPPAHEGGGLAGPLPVWTAAPDGTPLGVPRVEVALRGQSARVMLDTGASQHFLVAAAAFAYEIPSRPFSALATDAHGVRFEVSLAEPGSLLVPGRPPFAPPFLFLLENEALLASGVVGGLSPQLLAPPDHVSVLDLVRGELAVHARSSLSPSPSRGRVCSAGADPRDGWRYVVPVRLAGRTASLLVDTGAENTTLYERSPLASWLLDGRRTERVRVAGAASVVEMRLVEDVPVELGGASGDTGVTVGPGHGQCGEDGLLGFDILRRCRLAMDDEGIGVACASEDPPLHRAPPERAPEPLVLVSIDTDDACGQAGAELAPLPDSPLPFRFASALDAYAALASEVRTHSARIEDVCRGEGFLEARVRQPVFAREGSELRVRFSVDEGRRFTVERVTVSVSSTEGRRELELHTFPWLRTQRGHFYRRDDLLADAHALADALARSGMRVADAGFGRDENDDATVDVHFVIAID